MGLTSNGIEQTKAFELPGGIRADGECVASPRTALVKWRSSRSDMLYQIYVNGQYAGVTVDGEQRQMIIPIPTYSESPVRIEVFAVEPEEANTDFSNTLDSPLTDSGRVRISLLRSQSLPIGATAEIYFDNGTGQIDYEVPLTNAPIRIWPVQQDKAGFGMSRFGDSDFGYDSSAAVGFGKGSFGNGQFGLDADTIEWTSRSLYAGVYKFAVRIFDSVGNQSSTSETGPITVTPAARPVEQVSISSFDKQANQLVLKIADSV